ncbi:MAG: tetratricopeptide repeat protein [Bryobacteraceae bacterium]|nr:tetratricopeptide repeat protein [Bryobacteraceae bacterium]
MVDDSKSGAAGFWVWFQDEDPISSPLGSEPDRLNGRARPADSADVVEAIRLRSEGRDEEALDRLQRAAAEGDADALLLCGQICFELGELGAAAEWYARLQELQPGHPLASLNEGLCLGRLRRWDEARECLGRAVMVNPDRPEPWFLLGVALLHVGRAAESRPCFDRVLKLKQDYAPALFGQAVALHLEGRPEEALQLYELLLEDQPEKEELLTNALAAARKAKDAGRVNGFASRLLAVKPEAEAALKALASLAIDAGDPEQAAAWLERLVDAGALDGDQPLTESLALCLMGGNKREPERKAWKALLQAVPSHEYGLFRLATLEHQLGDTASAAEMFARCVELRDDWPEAWWNLAGCRWKMGDRDGAMQALKTARQLDPALATALASAAR